MKRSNDQVIQENDEISDCAKRSVIRSKQGENAMITLKNDFHNTEVRVNPKDFELSAGQVKRAGKVLCGINGCGCGNSAGMRGHDNPAIEFNQDWIDNKLVITGTILES